MSLSTNADILSVGPSQPEMRRPTGLVCDFLLACKIPVLAAASVFLKAIPLLFRQLIGHHTGPRFN